MLGCRVLIVRNDAWGAARCLQEEPGLIVIGPGPGGPEKSGVTLPLIEAAAGKVPILGICLGMQAIAAYYGAKIIPAKKPTHGKTSPIRHNGSGIFSGCPQHFRVCRYHSLAVQKESLPSCLEVTAETEEGEIMALKHLNLPIEGVQFHPESIATEFGLQLLENHIRSIYACIGSSLSS